MNIKINKEEIILFKNREHKNDRLTTNLPIPRPIKIWSAIVSVSDVFVFYATLDCPPLRLPCPENQDCLKIMNEQIFEISPKSISFSFRRL